MDLTPELKAAIRDDLDKHYVLLTHREVKIIRAILIAMVALTVGVSWVAAWATVRGSATAVATREIEKLRIQAEADELAIAKIRQSWEKDGSLSYLAALQQQIKLSDLTIKIGGFAEFEPATGIFRVRAINNAPGYAQMRVLPQVEKKWEQDFSGGVIELADQTKAQNIRLRLGVIGDDLRGGVVSVDGNTGGSNKPRVWP